MHETPANMSPKEGQEDFNCYKYRKNILSQYFMIILLS